jgi:hypothetical protein
MVPRLFYFSAAAFLFLNLQTSLAERTPAECLATTTDHSAYYCKPNQANRGVPCIDVEERCQGWAAAGECRSNPQFMRVECRKSCRSCLSVHVGVTQIAPDDELREAVHQRLIQTQEYVHKMIQHTVEYLDECKNNLAHCTFWAVKGKCETDPAFMNEECAPACQTCAL